MISLTTRSTFVSLLDSRVALIPTVWCVVENRFRATNMRAACLVRLSVDAWRDWRVKVSRLTQPWEENIPNGHALRNNRFLSPSLRHFRHIVLRALLAVLRCFNNVLTRFLDAEIICWEPLWRIADKDWDDFFQWRINVNTVCRNHN